MTITRSMTRVAGLAGLVLLVAVHTSTAQSLGALAKQTVSRQERPARVLTNADLPPADAPPAPVAPAAGAPAAGVEQPADGSSKNAADAAVAPDQPIKPRQKRTEEYWRNRSRDLQGRLAKVMADSAELASRLEALDAGPQTPAVLQERALVSAALTRNRADEGYLRTEINGFEARARSENVPAAWLR
jgi:hypothetical protein